MPSITLTYTAQVGTDFAAALGREIGLVAGVGAIRSATAAECKQWLASQARDLMRKQDLAIKREAIVPAADPVFT